MSKENGGVGWSVTIAIIAIAVVILALTGKYPVINWGDFRLEWGNTSNESSNQTSNVQDTPEIVVSSQATRLSPKEFIESYYQTLNDGNISSAWAMLTEEYQIYKAGGKESYIEWWKKVRHVELRDVSTINEEVPKVRVDLTYSMMDGDNVGEKPLIFTLRWNENINSWQISDSEKLD